ncbi:hypothetical protein ACIRNI_07250 [Streptomyces sp. NPDC093546]|uniref:hypothetical protein n=1 Tax=Streptomyces sp. NPDC093546 TaxID=3366040 RepID=UPI0037F31562
MEQSRLKGAAQRVGAWLLQIVGGLTALTGFTVWRSVLEDEDASIFRDGHPNGLLPPALSRFMEFIAGDSALTGHLLPTLVTLLGGTIYYSGQKLKRMSRRHFARIIGSPAEVADEPFVLYLRSFTDDPERRRGDINATPGIGGMLGDLTLSSYSEEEQLAAVLERKVAPMVAVGRPGEPLPEVGARRMYLPLDAWQEPVLELMRRARLVVLALGPGPGTMWELVQAARLLPPERLVLLVPLEPEEYEAFRGAFRERGTPLELPDHPPKPDFPQRHGRLGVKGVIYFAATGEPTFVRLDEVHGGPNYQAYRRFKRALRPVLRRAAGGPDSGPPAAT